VIKFARTLGPTPPRTLVVGCEPQAVIGGDDYEEMLMELSEPVQAAVEEAAKLVESLVGQISKEVKS
jgi:Ni,Fe-hydrogenase maturation factor